MNNLLFLYIEMSAAEFKTYLKSKGRVDPRITQVDMRQKFQMFQDMQKSNCHFIKYTDKSVKLKRTLTDNN